MKRAINQFFVLSNIAAARSRAPGRLERRRLVDVAPVFQSDGVFGHAQVARRAITANTTC
jgi:hypothetical protein